MNASTQNLLVFLCVGIVAGWLAGRIMKGGGFGLLGDMIIGVLGAFVGGWLFGRLGIVTWGLAGTFITALVGALVLLFLARLLKRG
jgi:uncharacterized membrane protein YeaQ/YmgE (transglycosylase-associated protein family)